MDSYYDILGLEPGASQVEVKKAYFKLVRQYPPESAPEQFQKIREAYEQLKNADNKSEEPVFPPFSEPWAEKMFKQIEIYRKEGDLKMYRDACEEAWHRFPKDIRFLYLLTGAQRKYGNTGKAVKNAELLVKKEPENKWFRRELAISYMERGFTQKAYFACEAAYAAGCRDLDFVLMYAIECDGYGEYDRGVEILLEIIRGEKKWVREEIPELLEIYFRLLKMSCSGTNAYFSEILESFCEKLEQYKAYLAEYMQGIAGMITYIGAYADVSAEEYQQTERLFSILRDSCHSDSERGFVDDAKIEFNYRRLDVDMRIGDTLKRAYDVYYDYVDPDPTIKKYALIDTQLCMIEERKEILEQAEIIRKDYPDYYEMLADFLWKLENEKSIVFIKDSLLKTYRRLSLDCSGGYYYEKYPKEKEKAMGKVISDGMFDEPYVRSSRKIGRNDPCPCGSGKKYKHCCMKKQM